MTGGHYYMLSLWWLIPCIDVVTMAIYALLYDATYDVLSLWWLMHYYMTKGHLWFVVTMVTYNVLIMAVIIYMAQWSWWWEANHTLGKMITGPPFAAGEWWLHRLPKSVDLFSDKILLTFTINWGGTMLCCLHIQYDGSILLPTTVPKFLQSDRLGSPLLVHIG